MQCQELSVGNVLLTAAVVQALSNDHIQRVLRQF